jgi:hypothetical protein
MRFSLNRVPGGIRTPNLLIRSQKLYPVELQALRNCGFSISDFRLDRVIVDLGPANLKSAIENLKLDGVADGIRTRNNQNHNLGLYH